MRKDGLISQETSFVDTLAACNFGNLPNHLEMLRSDQENSSELEHSQYPRDTIFANRNEPK